MNYCQMGMIFHVYLLYYVYWQLVHLKLCVMKIIGGLIWKCSSFYQVDVKRSYTLSICYNFFVEYLSHILHSFYSIYNNFSYFNILLLTYSNIDIVLDTLICWKQIDHFLDFKSPIEVVCWMEKLQICVFLKCKKKLISITYLFTISRCCEWNTKIQIFWIEIWMLWSSSNLKE